MITPIEDRCWQCGGQVAAIRVEQWGIDLSYTCKGCDSEYRAPTPYALRDAFTDPVAMRRVPGYIDHAAIHAPSPA